MLPNKTGIFEKRLKPDFVMHHKQKGYKVSVALDQCVRKLFLPEVP